MAKAKLAPALASFGLDEDDLLRRALAAWFRKSESVDIPSNMSSAETHGGHWYVVLRGGRGPSGQPLAVYRLKNDGILRQLRRWPSAIE